MMDLDLDLTEQLVGILFVATLLGIGIGISLMGLARAASQPHQTMADAINMEVAMPAAQIEDRVMPSQREVDALRSSIAQERQIRLRAQEELREVARHQASLEATALDRARQIALLEARVAGKEPPTDESIPVLKTRITRVGSET